MTSNKLGITQGRLTNTNEKLLQFLPEDWEYEFHKLKEVNIDFIELFSEQINDFCPIWNRINRERLKKVLQKNKINQFYFCDNFILRKSTLDNDYISYLNKLTQILLEFENPFIIIPLETFSKQNNLDEVIYCIKNILNIISKYEINFSFEICESYEHIFYIEEKLNDKRFKITFDTGNFYLLNLSNDRLYNNLKKLFHLINHIHLKDRDENHQNVVLRKGNINFKPIFDLLRENQYHGNFTLECHRGRDALKNAHEASLFVKSFIS